LEESVTRSHDGLLAEASAIMDGLVGERVVASHRHDILSRGRALELLHLQ
jgi:hypothetical protein